MGTLESTISPTLTSVRPNGEHRPMVIRQYFRDSRGNPVVLPLDSREAALVVSRTLDRVGARHELRVRIASAGKVLAIWRSGSQLGWLPIEEFQSFEGVADELVGRQIRFLDQLAKRRDR